MRAENTNIGISVAYTLSGSNDWFASNSTGTIFCWNAFHLKKNMLIFGGMKCRKIPFTPDASDDDLHCILFPLFVRAVSPNVWSTYASHVKKTKQNKKHVFSRKSFSIKIFSKQKKVKRHAGLFFFSTIFLKIVENLKWKKKKFENHSEQTNQFWNTLWNRVAEINIDSRHLAA